MNIDIIILSYAKTDELKQITLDCVESLLSSEKSGNIVFEALVIESNKKMSPYQYPGTKTIYPDEVFGYNKYMNIGINMTHNAYVCMCNNDLIFHEGWATEILKAFKQIGFSSKIYSVESLDFFKFRNTSGRLVAEIIPNNKLYVM